MLLTTTKSRLLPPPSLLLTASSLFSNPQLTADVEEKERVPREVLALELAYEETHMHANTMFYRLGSGIPVQISPA